MAPPPPELIEELVEEVLLRFPPDDPASLARAALVCKLWCRLVSAAAFRCRFREFHFHHRGAAAPLLGVLYNTTVDDDADAAGRPAKRARRILRDPTPTACFAPTTACRPAVHTDGWRAIDAHHGRVLLCRPTDPRRRGLALSVWDPITGEQRDLPESPPLLRSLGYAAAVTCAATAADSCDHLDCHRGPFQVVAIDVQPYMIVFSVYSSEAGAWSDPTVLEHSTGGGALGLMEHTPGVLTGGALYFPVHFCNEIVEFDLATQEVSTLLLQPEFRPLLEQGRIVLVTGDNGELGFVVNREGGRLELWSMVPLPGGDVTFVLTRVIDLHKVLFPFIQYSSVQVNGFADCGAARFLFMRTSDGLYSMEINSSHVRKVANCCGDEDDDVVPYISFCTPTALPDARPTTATAVDSEDDGLQKIVPRRTRTRNPRFYGPEWANK